LANKKTIKNIERFGERYCKKYLNIWDKDKLENNWWYSLEFFFSHSFMRGRRDVLSNEYHQFTNSTLKDYLSIDPMAINISYNKLKKDKIYLIKDIILDFKSRKNILKRNSIAHGDFEKEISSKNPIITSLLLKKEIKVKWDERYYLKKIHLGNDQDIMMVLDVLHFISTDKKHMNIYNYLNDVITESGVDGAYSELLNIYAIGDKIATFIIRDIGMMNPKIIKGDFRFAFPVDTWVYRIANKLGCKGENIDRTKECLINKCKMYDVNPLKFAAGLWYLGFNSLDILLEDCLDRIKI